MVGRRTFRGFMLASHGWWNNKNKYHAIYHRCWSHYGMMGLFYVCYNLEINWAASLHVARCQLKWEQSDEWIQTSLSGVQKTKGNVGSLSLYQVMGRQPVEMYNLDAGSQVNTGRWYWGTVKLIQFEGLWWDEAPSLPSLFLFGTGFWYVLWMFQYFCVMQSPDFLLGIMTVMLG